MYEIDWSKKAAKQLVKSDHTARNMIVGAVRSLRDFPNAKNVIALANHKHGYRLRVGNYRVLSDADTRYASS